MRKTKKPQSNPVEIRKDSRGTPMKPQNQARANVGRFTAAMSEQAGRPPTRAERRAAFYLERQGYHFAVHYGFQNILTVAAGVRAEAGHRRWLAARSVKLFLSGYSIASVSKLQKRLRSEIEGDLRVRLARRSGPAWLRP